MNNNEFNMEMNSFLDELVREIPYERIKALSNNIRDKYRDKESKGKDYEITTLEEAYTYGIYRMTQTSMVIKRVLDELIDAQIDTNIASILDIGAGTGASLLPISETFEDFKITLLEEQKSMIHVLEKTIKYLNLEDRTNIIHKEAENFKKDSYDLVLASYMLNELTEEELKDFSNTLIDVTKKHLILIVPGTPDFFKKLEFIKVILIEKGFKIIAPCIGTHPCHLGKDDWCHFSQRVERSSTLRRIKEGEMSYEDEKFSYCILTKEEYPTHEESQANEGNNTQLDKEHRIIRHPFYGKGTVDLLLCNLRDINSTKITKGRNKDIYKEVRKLKWGDKFIF